MIILIFLTKEFVQLLCVTVIGNVISYFVLQVIKTIYRQLMYLHNYPPSINSGSLVAVEGHRQTPMKHTSKPLIGFLCVSYIQTALNLAISLLREYQYVSATLCALVNRSI